MPRQAAFSLADFAAAGVRLRPTDAVTIVRALVAQVAEGTLPGVPSAHVIRLSPSGAVTIEGPVVASGRPLPRAAQLLAALLRGSQRNASEPTRLRRVIAQALLDPPGFATLNDFAAALAPFAAQDSAAAIRELTARLSEVEHAVSAESALVHPDDTEAPGEMTVSDIRRARRDTGLSLHEISKRSRIPVSLLRQLEWGYLRNWPNGLYGRTQLARYARAAGLNKQVVLEAIRPLMGSSGEALDAPVMHPLAVGDRGERPVSSGIQIVQPTFAADEVLFEAEHGPEEASGMTAAPTVRHPAIAPAVKAAVSTVQQAAVAEREEPDPAAHVVLDTRVSGAVVPAPVQVAEPAVHSESLLYADFANPADANDAPRRSSKMAAAAVLALAAAGAFWGIQSGGDSNERISSRVVRRMPMRDRAIETPAAPDENSRVHRQPAPPQLRNPNTRDGRRPGPEPVVHIAPVPPLRPADVADDEALEATPSAGGVAFADPVLLATGLGNGSDGGLGLRITRVLDDQGRNEHARPSPDGTRVAFDSDRDGERAVFVADANGQNLRRVSGAGAAAAPNWSSNGRTLSYVRAEDHNPSVWNLWALDLSTGESRRLTSHTSGRPAGGAWFPDGKRLAYSRGSDILVLEVTSGRLAVYPAPQAGRRVGPPAVSPDGRWIVYHVQNDGAWLMDLGDGSSRKVLTDPSIGDLAWSPDGSRVAFYSRRGREWGVWMMASR